MAATIRDVITLALKKLTVVRGSGEPKSQDAADALASLSSFYAELISNGTCGRVYEFPVTQGYDNKAWPNTHYAVMDEDGVDIELPDTVPTSWWGTWVPSRDYGWGLNVPYADGITTPRDLGIVRITHKDTDERATYMYDATVQRWMRVDNLNIPDQHAVLNREAPLSARNMDGLAALLATRIADQFGQDLLSPLTIRAANAFKVGLVTNMGSIDRHNEHHGWC